MNTETIQKADAIDNVCANCYKETDNRFTVGSIEHFGFCSLPCGMEALKRKGAM